MAIRPISESTNIAVGAFSVWRSAAVAAAAAGTIICDNEEYDVNGWHDTTTGRYTPLVAGYYSLSGGIAFAAQVAANYVQTEIWKNGALYKILGQIHNANTAYGLAVSGSVPVQANGTTDYFQLRWSSDSSGAPPLVGQTRIYFAGYYIGR